MVNVPRYVTIAQVRTVCGITSSLVVDDDVSDITYDVEFQIERFLNTTFTPKKEIDVLDGVGKDTIYTKNNPLLAIRSLTDDGVTVDVTKLNFTKGGRIRFNSTNQTTTTTFKERENGVILEYVFGNVFFPESKGTETLLDGATTVGSAVVMTVDSETDFSVDDWVEIYGTDGFREASQITATGTKTITVDQLVYTHVDNSFVRKLEIPVLVERLMKVSAGIALVAIVVGSSFDDIVGYTMGQFSVQKGEPYTQWRETALQLINERDRILERLQPAAFSVVM